MNQLENTLTSLEVAEMVGRDHNNVLKDIRNIIEQIGAVKNYHTYFVEDVYKDIQGKGRPCFKLTKKGCELFGGRMSGAKGTHFAMDYIERFNQMERHIKQQTSNLSPELQMFNQLFQASANVELEQKRQAEELDAVKNSVGAVEKSVDNISEIVALNTTNWREDSNNLIRKISQKVGGDSGAYSDIRNEIYLEVDRRAGAKLKVRLQFLRDRMRREGESKSKIDKTNKLDVLEKDKRLREIYIAIVKEFAIKYQVDVA